jgi:hypothetical protein
VIAGPALHGRSAIAHGFDELFAQFANTRVTVGRPRAPVTSRPAGAAVSTTTGTTTAAANLAAAAASWARLDAHDPGTSRRLHITAIGTFANRRSQYVPIGNVTASPSCQPAHATA